MPLFFLRIIHSNWQPSSHEYLWLTRSVFSYALFTRKIKTLMSDMIPLKSPNFPHLKPTKVYNLSCFSVSSNICRLCRSRRYIPTTQHNIVHLCTHKTHFLRIYHEYIRLCWSNHLPLCWMWLNLIELNLFFLLKFKQYTAMMHIHKHLRLEWMRYLNVVHICMLWLMLLLL